MAVATATPSLREQIEEFLYREAKLLDAWDLHAWLDLLTDDVHYWMPTRENLPQAAQPVEENDLAFGLYDEDKAALELRVRRLDTGLAHVEEPRSITRRFISNVLVTERSAPDEVVAESNFLVFQLRHRSHETYFVGSRVDVLRRVGESWKIAKRKILLDQMILPRTLSIFF